MDAANAASDEEEINEREKHAGISVNTIWKVHANQIDLPSSPSLTLNDRHRSVREAPVTKRPSVAAKPKYSVQFQSA